ncbi:hypothetical protein JDFnp4_174 [Fusobacterium phage JD-Fnp4]|nr:hypothetical protein JDFnp4_174 [Fusobacterium phage JD-Fnp4]
MKLNSRIYNIERTNAMRNAMRGRMSVDDALEYFFENDTKMLEKLIDVYNYNMKMYHTCGEDADNILTVDKLRDIRIAAKFKIDEDAQIHRYDRLKYARLCDMLLSCIADVTMVESLIDFMRSDDAMSIEAMILDGDLALEKAVEDDFVIDESFGNTYYPFTVKKTIRQWREDYMTGFEEELPSKLLEKIYGNEEYINVDIQDEKKANTTLILLTMSLSVAFNVLYKNFDLEDDYISLDEWITACMDSDMIPSVLYRYSVTTAVAHIMDFVVHNISWITNALFIFAQDSKAFTKFIDEKVDGPYDRALIKKYFDIVKKDSV